MCALDSQGISRSEETLAQNIAFLIHARGGRAVKRRTVSRITEAPLWGTSTADSLGWGYEPHSARPRPSEIQIYIYIRVILGLYWGSIGDTGKENGGYYLEAILVSSMKQQESDKADQSVKIMLKMVKGASRQPYWKT